jgi:UDP-N-acetyl-D-glucosamine dehydrogenase
MSTTSDDGRSDPATPIQDDRLVAVIGQGYVGLPVAVRAAEMGFSVVGYDTDEALIERLARCESQVEDVSRTRLAAVLDAGTYRPSVDPDAVKGYDIAVISVPTPLRDGQPDLTFIKAAGRLLGAHLAPGATVILESTTWPGTTEEILGPILEAESGLRAGRDFHLGYSPERIDPGNQVWSFETTPKVVSGIDDASLRSVEQFFGQLIDTTVAVRSPKEAELTKLLENLYRHVNIALVNELAVFARELDIDIWSTLDAAATKPFGFMRFDPGPGVGGHCLPIDPSYLSWRVRQSLGRPFRFVELANDINNHMPDYVVQRLMMLLNRHGMAVRDRRLLVLGFSYKRNTGDARESPARPIVNQLLGLGAEVRVADPHVRADQVPDGVELIELTTDELAQADATLVLVDHDQFDAGLVRRHAQLVLDTRNWLGAGERIERL